MMIKISPNLKRSLVESEREKKKLSETENLTLRLSLSSSVPFTVSVSQSVVNMFTRCLPDLASLPPPSSPTTTHIAATRLPF